MVNKDVIKRKFNLQVKILVYVCASIFSFSGCGVVDTISSLTATQPQVSGQYVSEELASGNIKKVLIAPFSYESGPERIEEKVARDFAVELGKTGVFQVIKPSFVSDELVAAKRNLWERGSIDVNTLLKVKKEFGVDGIVFGEVTHYKPFMPLTLGLRIVIISALSGGTVWSVEGVYDSDHKDVVQAAKNYYKKNYRNDQSLYGWELMLISMERYTRFITNMLVTNMVKSIPEK